MSQVMRPRFLALVLVVVVVYSLKNQVYGPVYVHYSKQLNNAFINVQIVLLPPSNKSFQQYTTVLKFSLISSVLGRQFSKHDMIFILK